MRYDPFFDYAMDDFYRSAAIVSAVILFFLFLASPAQANYIYDNATGSWKPSSRTVLAPPGAGSPFNYIPRDTPPTVSSSGDFINKTGGTFGSPPVNGASRTVPVTVNGTTTKPNVNKALLSRLGKGGLAGIALGAGIDALLDGIGALIDDAGNVSRISPPVIPPLLDCPSCVELPSVIDAGRQYENCANPVRPQLICVGTGFDPVASTPMSFYCGSNNGGMPLVGTGINPSNGYSTCLFSSTVPLPEPQLTPFPTGELEDAINGGYQPHPSDYPFLAPDPAMQPTIVEVEPIPRLDFAPTTTTTTDLDTGKTTTVTHNIWKDFSVKDNNSPQPKIQDDTTAKSETYVDGEKTGESTTTSSSGTSHPEGAFDSQGNQLELPPPIDCDLFPTACAWMQWTQEEPEEPDDNLSDLLQEVTIVNETFTITGGVAGCPAPLVLNLSQFGSREVSYQPLCDLASTMKFLYLALMSFAAAVLLNRSINRV